MDKQVQDVGFTAFSVTNTPLPATQRKTLALTAPQTSFYAVQSADCGALYQEIMDSIARSGEGTVISNAIAFDQRLRTGGLRPREDLFSFFGPETAAVGTWREGASMPDAAIAIEIRNPAQTRARIDLALRALKEIALGDDVQYPWDDIQDQGETLHTVHAGSNLIAPTYAVTDGFLILALTPDYARELLAQLKQSKPTLASSASYQQAMSRLPPANACAYGYCDLNAVFRPLYTRLRAFATDGSPGLFAGLNKLPQTETIARHLTPFAAATVADATGQNVHLLFRAGQACFLPDRRDGCAGVRPTIPGALPVDSQCILTQNVFRYGCSPSPTRKSNGSVSKSAEPMTRPARAAALRSDVSNCSAVRVR